MTTTAHSTTSTATSSTPRPPAPGAQERGATRFEAPGTPAAPTRHPGGALIAGTGLLGGGAALGAAITTAGPTRTGELHLDQVIAADRVAPLTSLAHLIDIGLGPHLAPILLVVLCAAIALKNRWAAATLGLITITGWLSVAIGKVLYARPRPPAQLVHALVHETKPDSFPSGHTAFAVALLAGTILALKVAHHSTRWAWALGIPAVLVVAASRLYLGAHYLGDVVGSYLFAGGTVLILGAVLSLARTRVLARASTQS